MKALRPLTASLILLTSCLLVSNTTLAKTMLKLDHNQDKSHAVHRALDCSADRTKEYSNGKLVIRIYPNTTLDNGHESLELVNSDALQMVKASAASLESFVPDYSPFGPPFLLCDRDHHYRVLQSDLGKKILNSSERKGFVGTAHYNDGVRSFYSNKPITKSEDLAGMEIRVRRSSSAIAMMKVLGGVATPMAQDEFYTVLQQGVVDGEENNTVVYADMRHVEVIKVYSRDEHTMIPDVLIVSTNVSNKLGDKERATLLKAANESMMQMEGAIWPAAEKGTYDKMKGMNTTVVDVDKSVFKERVKPLYDEFKAGDTQSAKNLELVKSM